MKSSIDVFSSERSLWLWALTLCLILLGATVQRGLVQYPYDDALIHLRVAHNFVATGFPYFDPTRPIFATSSLIWTCVLALVMLISGAQFPDILNVVGLLNAVCAALAALVWTRIAQELVKLTRLQQTLVCLAVWSILLPSAVGLMETSMAMLLAGVTLRFLLRERSIGWFLLGCLPFVRPEFALLSVLLLCAHYYLSRGFTWRPVALCALGAMPWTVGAFFYFHTVIPHTIRAKSLVYWVNLTEFSQLLMRTWMSDGFVAGNRLLAASYFLLGFLAVLALVFRKAGDQLNKPVQLHACVFGISLLGVALAIPTVYALKHALLFPWYAPLYFIPLVVSATLLLEGIWRLIGVLYLAFPTWGVACGIIWAGLHQQYIWYPDFAAVARVHSLLAYGKELSAQFPKKVLLAPEIGALGIQYDGTLIDGVGLVTPEALQYHPLKIPEERKSGLIGAVPPQFVAAAKPDLIFGLSIFLESFAQSEFAKDYQLTEKPLFLPDDAPSFSGLERLWKSDVFQLWIRKAA